MHLDIVAISVFYGLTNILKYNYFHENQAKSIWSLLLRNKDVFINTEKVKSNL